MAIIKSLFENISLLSKQTNNIPVTNQEIGMSSFNFNTQQPDDREAIYPNWFFSARLGQPRGIDTRKLRNLAQSPWAQMVIRTFKHQISTVEWDIVPEDEDKEIDRKQDIKKVKDFLKAINDNKQSVNDINSEGITDLAEIDAGCFNYVYSSDSYTISELPLYNAWGEVIGTETGLMLKPLGQRKLVKVKAVDGSTMLKQVDIRKNLLNFWQYSFKHPRQNPTRFEKEEIEYFILNPRSYDVYGFSPMQSIQQVIELLIQGTRYNKDLYTNNAMPDLLVSLPKLSKDQLKRLKREWNNSYKGKPHQMGFINWTIDKIEKLSANNRDLEWLEGQKWYFKLVFAVYGVSPEEAGFTESSNRATGDSQERVTIRNAMRPYFQKFEQIHTNKTITEILQNENHGLKFKYFPKDHTLEKIEFEQQMQELLNGIMTINEYRKLKGRDEVEWGDEPLRRPMNMEMMQNSFNSNNPKPSENNSEKDEKDKNKIFRKKFEAFVDGRKSNS